MQEKVSGKNQLNTLQQWKKWPYTTYGKLAARNEKEASSIIMKRYWSNFFVVNVQRIDELTTHMNEQNHNWGTENEPKDHYVRTISFKWGGVDEKGHMPACIHCCSHLTGKQVKETELETTHHNWRWVVIVLIRTWTNIFTKLNNWNNCNIYLFQNHGLYQLHSQSLLRCSLIQPSLAKAQTQRYITII